MNRSMNLQYLYAHECYMCSSSHWLNKMITAEEARGVHPSRIGLLGYCQGSALALYTAMKHERELAGVALFAG